MSQDTDPSGDERRSIASPLAFAVLGAALVWLTWRFFVRTRVGQMFDQLALQGSLIGSWRVNTQADTLLDTVSAWAVAALLLAAVAIGALRGRLMHGVVAALAVVGANVTTQVLKYWVFGRDDLLSLGAYNGRNSLPSGHTTVAASALVALILVVPPMLRALVTVAGVVAVPAFGLATLVNQWHRASDVIAAVAVACAWGGLAVAAMRLWDRRSEAPELRHAPGALSVVLITLAIAGAGVAGLSLALTWRVDPAAASRPLEFLAYAGGVAALVAVAFGGMGTLLRLVDASRPAPRR